MIGENLHGGSGPGDGEVLVDQGVGNQLADSQFRIRMDGRAECLADVLALRELVVDVADRLLEAYGVAFAGNLLFERADAVVAAVNDDAESLAGEPLEFGQARCKQDRPDISNVLPVVASLCDKGFRSQTLQDGDAVDGKRLLH